MAISLSADSAESIKKERAPIMCVGWVGACLITRAMGGVSGICKAVGASNGVRCCELCHVGFGWSHECPPMPDSIGTR